MTSLSQVFGGVLDVLRELRNRNRSTAGNWWIRLVSALTDGDRRGLFEAVERPPACRRRLCGAPWRILQGSR